MRISAFEPDFTKVRVTLSYRQQVEYRRRPEVILAGLISTDVLLQKILYPRKIFTAFTIL